MKYRKLRIAWLVACSLVGIPLIALWVRSYFAFDRVSGQVAGRTSLICVSYAGSLSAVVTDFRNLHWPWPLRDSGPIMPNRFTTNDWAAPSEFTWSNTDVVWPRRTILGFGWIRRELYINIPNRYWGWQPQGLSGRSWAAGATGFIVPYSFVFLLLAVAAGLPWFRWRFSLRTLLIGMTLLAVLLAAAVWD